MDVMIYMHDEFNRINQNLRKIGESRAAENGNKFRAY